MDEQIRARKKSMVLELLPKKNYHIGKVIEAVGISRMALHKWRKEDAEFNEAFIEVFENDIDDAEEKMNLLRKGIPRIEDGKFVGWIEKPHFKALALFLKAKAKHRGWGDTLEVKNVSDVSELTDEEIEKELYELGYEPRKEE